MMEALAFWVPLICWFVITGVAVVALYGWHRANTLAKEQLDLLNQANALLARQNQTIATLKRLLEGERDRYAG